MVVIKVVGVLSRISVCVAAFNSSPAESGPPSPMSRSGAKVYTMDNKVTLSELSAVKQPQ